MGLRELAQYFTNQRNLYFRNVGGWLSRCIGPEEAERRLKKTHEKHCETTEIPLYTRIQREGYFWPSMKQDGAELQRKCDKCQLFFEAAECRFVEAQPDWRQHYIDFIRDGVVPTEKVDAMGLKRRPPKFYVQEGQLYRRGYFNRPLHCITKE